MTPPRQKRSPPGRISDAAKHDTVVLFFSFFSVELAARQHRCCGLRLLPPTLACPSSPLYRLFFGSCSPLCLHLFLYMLPSVLLPRSCFIPLAICLPVTSGSSWLYTNRYRTHTSLRQIQTSAVMILRCNAPVRAAVSVFLSPVGVLSALDRLSHSSADLVFSSVYVATRPLVVVSKEQV